MMTRTCTVQVNLDYASEADMVKKFRVSLALQPVATALFADSPFTEGKPNGYLSYRSHIWTDTDPDRTGMLDFVFEDGFGYERYVDYLLDVPMYFSYRDGVYVDASGKSFRKFLKGELDVLPGALPTLRDWSDHMTTAFPEVRLKKLWRCAAPTGARGTGCARCPRSGSACSTTRSHWTRLRPGQGLQHRRAPCPARWRAGHALGLPFRGASVRELAVEALKISVAGLRRRAALNADGIDESRFLEPLIEIAESGQTAAERKLELFHGRWNGDIDRVFPEFAY